MHRSLQRNIQGNPSLASPPRPTFHKTTLQHQNQETDIDTTQAAGSDVTNYTCTHLYFCVYNHTQFYNVQFCIITTTIKTPRYANTRSFFIGTHSPHLLICFSYLWFTNMNVHECYFHKCYFHVSMQLSTILILFTQHNFLEIHPNFWVYKWFIYYYR